MSQNAYYSAASAHSWLPGNAAPDFADLIEKIARLRDRHAFVTVFDYFAPRVKAYLMRGGLTETEAEELAQDTMLQVWQKAAQFDPARAKASTWIYTIARNKKIDRLRKNKFSTIDIDHLADIGEEPASEENQDMLASGHMAERLTNAIQELPEEQASLVRQAFFEDLSHADIAARTKIPLGTVKSRLRLGLARLRKSLFENKQDDTSLNYPV